MTRADNSDDAIREEFLAEANEIVESLSRDLLVLDQGQNERSHELVNEVFRGVHTLKGMAGMFGYQQVSAVAHELENLLDDLRVGRIELNREVLDVLFAGVETFQKLLAADQGGEADDATELSRNIERLASQSRQPRDPLKVYDLPETVLSVLTDFVETPAHTTCDAPRGRGHARTLREIACELAGTHAFSSVLTPNYNDGHRNHFHLDARPDDPRTFVR